MTTPERIAWSVTEAAEALGVHPASVRRLIAAGQLGSLRVGRRVLVPDAELRRLVACGGWPGNGARG